MVTTSTKRERAAHLGPERRRPAVLDAAQAIAVRDGLGAVTIAAVAGSMAVTRPVIYSCYPDRVTLLDALLERESQSLLAATLDALHSASGDDPEQTFVDGYRALLHAVAARPEGWRLVFDARPDPEVARLVADARRRIVDASTRWIAPALERWWQTEDLERKLPALIELFVSSCEAAIRIVINPATDWSADDLAALYGQMMAAAYRTA